MTLKEYITPLCENLFLQAETSFLLVASAGGAGEAGLLGDPSLDNFYEL